MSKSKNIFQIKGFHVKGCPFGRYTQCASIGEVCDFFAIVRDGDAKGAYCIANAKNDERFEFLNMHPLDNGYVLNILKEQGYGEKRK